MSIFTKIIGFIACAVGLGVWYLDYLIFTAIGSLTLWIATEAGITGNAALGVQIIGWILTIGVMFLLIILGGIAILSGFNIILEE